MNIDQIDEYSFNDLDTVIQNQLINVYRNINVNDDNWIDAILEQFYPELESLGVNLNKISYSSLYGIQFKSEVGFELISEINSVLASEYAELISDKYIRYYLQENMVFDKDGNQI